MQEVKTARYIYVYTFLPSYIVVTFNVWYIPS